MIRAAARARAVAASTNTSIHIMRDGAIVEIWPKMEDPHSAPTVSEDEPELSVVREDTSRSRNIPLASYDYIVNGKPATNYGLGTTVVSCATAVSSNRH